MTYCTGYESPLGTLTLYSDGTALTALTLPKWRFLPADAATAVRRDDLAVFDHTRAWLDAYFAAATLPALPQMRLSGSAFRRRVWELLLEIPYGQTTTYGAISNRLETETGARQSAQAVGGAVGRNPIAILVPCHRCVGSGGSLTGYGGGLDAKIALLAIEGVEPGRFRRPTHGTAL